MERKIQVLIVEDEPPTARFVKMLTEQNEKYEVSAICESAEEAVDYLELYEHPDLIITDIRMSKMSGLDLLKSVREKNSQIKLLIISGYRTFEYAKEGIRLDIEDYITKPIDPNEFHRVLDRVSTFYENKRHLREKEYLIKAFQEKDEKSIQEILKKYTEGVLIVYQAAKYKQEFQRLESIQKSMLAIPYEECMFVFWKAERETEREKKKLEIGLLKQKGKGTFCMIWLDEFPNTSEIMHAIWDVYESMQKLIVPGEHYNVHEKSVNDISFLKKREHTEELKNISIYIQSENWNKVKKEIEKLCQRWELDRSTLYDIRKEVYFILEYFRKANKPEVRYNSSSQKIEYLLRHADNYTELIKNVKNILWQLLEPIIENTHGETQKEYSLVQNIIALVEKNMDKNYSLAEISDYYGLSQPYIRKIFKRYTNNSYNKYVLEQKILYAQKMMKENPNILIKDIADALGYEPFYFSTVFNKNTGLTPSEYKMKLEKQDK